VRVAALAAFAAVACRDPARGEAAEGVGRAGERCSVVLTGAGADEIELIKAIRGVTRLGLRDARDLATALPSVILADVPRRDAEAAAARLEAAGAEVEIRAP
jgi:large subunit ribosomal protein L7/L12